MATLTLGIAIGATFAEFWRFLFKFTARKCRNWMNKQKQRECEYSAHKVD